MSVSAELRRFMADEVVSTAHGMTTKDNIKSNKPLNASVSASKSSNVPKYRKSYKDAVQADLELSTTKNSLDD